MAHVWSPALYPIKREEEEEEIIRQPRCFKEKAMAPHSSTLAWKVPWAEEPGRLQSMGSLRVGHDWAISLSLFTFMHWRRKWQPTPVFLPGESQGWGAWWAAIYGVAQSRTRLMWLSSSSSSRCFKKKKKNFSFVSTPDVCGAFHTTSNSTAQPDVLQFTLILTLCAFLNVLSGPTV